MADDVLLTSPKNTVQKLKWIDDGVGGYWAPVVWNANGGGGGGGGGGGDASASNQGTQITLATAANTKLDSIAGSVDGLEGLAGTGNTSLSSIDSKTPALSGGAVPVVAAALPLPTGAATAAAQGTGNTSLGNIDGKLPALSGGAVPVVMAASPLPTGAATAANQATANTSLGSIDTKLTAVATAAAQATGNTSLASIDTKFPAKGAAAAAASLPVTLATDGQFVTSIGSLTETAPATDTASSGVNGRLQRLAQRITALIGLLPTALGPAVMAASLPVVLPTDPDYRPASVTISALDTGTGASASTPVTGSASVNSITGTPTPNSFATFAVNGFVEACIQITGMTGGSLVFEGSIDGGTTYQSMPAHVSGINRELSTINGAGQFILPCGGRTHVRVRCTVALAGSPVVVTAVFAREGTLVKANGGEVSILDGGFRSVVTITRPANATPYTAGDVIGGAFAIPIIGGIGGNVVLTFASLRYDVSALPAGMGNTRLYLYDSNPASAIADNAAFAYAVADRGSLLGYIDLGTLVLYVNTLFLQQPGGGLQLKLAAGSTTLWGYLVTSIGFTPAGSSEVLTLDVRTLKA